MPFLAMCVILFMVTLGIATEMMRDFETVNQLDLAARSIALNALPQGVNYLSTYANSTTAQSNVSNQILQDVSSTWNLADSGPNLNTPNQPVAIAQDDINFVLNSNESSLPPGRQEWFLDITARRQGQAAIPQIFMPLAYINMAGAALPAQFKTFATSRTIELFGQPANAIGQADPTGPDAQNHPYYLFGALPIAISFADFVKVAQTPSLATEYSIDLSGSQTALTPVGGASVALHGLLVNLLGTSGGVGPFGPATDATATSQLLPMLSYFAKQGGVPSSSVRYTDAVSGYNENDPGFPSGQIASALNQLVLSSSSSRYFMVPVIEGPAGAQPSDTQTNTVIGFAWMHIVGTAQNPTTLQPELLVTFGDSVPVPNAVASPALNVTVSATTGQATMAAYPPFPFSPRTYDPTTNSVPARPFGVVLAPALSPRLVQIPQS